MLILSVHKSGGIIQVLYKLPLPLSYSLTHTHSHTHAFTQSQKCVHRPLTQSHSSPFRSTHTRTHTHTHTHTHTPTHTHTHPMVLKIPFCHTTLHSFLFTAASRQYWPLLLHMLGLSISGRKSTFGTSKVTVVMLGNCETSSALLIHPLTQSHNHTHSPKHTHTHNHTHSHKHNFSLSTSGTELGSDSDF